MPFDENTTFLTTNATTARSVKQRWSDTVHAMDFGLDNTGASATAHTAISAAITEAIARNRSEVRLPPGELNFGGTLTVVNENTNKKIRIIGCGRGTRIKKSAGTGLWIQIGQNTNELSGGTRTGGINWESMDFVPSTLMTANEIFNLKFTKDCSFKDMHFGETGTNGVFSAFSLGVGAGAVNNTAFIDIIDCPIIATTDVGQAGIPAVRLGSGGALNIKGSGRHDGQDLAYFIKHADTSFNWDGLYVPDLFAAGFERYIDSVGAGISDMIWSNGQCDGGNIAFNANAAIGGLNDKWDIHGVQILNGTADTGSTKPIVWSNASGGKSGALNFSNNRIERYTQYANIVSTVGDGGDTQIATMVGNTFGGCGNAGTELIRIGSAGQTTAVAVVGNTGHTTSGTMPGGSTYTYGINWVTSDPTRRVKGSNLFINYGTAAENGSI